MGKRMTDRERARRYALQQFPLDDFPEDEAFGYAPTNESMRTGSAADFRAGLRAGRKLEREQRGEKSE